MSIEQFLALFGGVQAVLIALVAYLGKIWLSRMEKSIDAALKTAVHVAQAQFDREFKLYEDLWKQLGQIRSQIRETLTSGSMESNTAERSVLLAARADELYSTIEANEPFLPEEFVVDLALLRELAVHWSTQVKEGKMQDGSWFFEEGVTHLERLNTAYDSLKQKIRNRLHGAARNGVTRESAP